MREPAFRTLRTAPRDDEGTAEAAQGGGSVRPARGSATRRNLAEKWTTGRETSNIGEMLASRLIECLPLVHLNIVLILFIYI